MTKMQKKLLWLFGAMFLIPEILFSIILSSIVNYSGKDFLTLTSIFVDSRFFINNPTYFLIILIIELIGITGLLFLSIKNRRKIMSTILIIILLWLIFIFFLGSVSGSINLLM